MNVHVKPEYRDLYPRRDSIQLAELEAQVLSARRIYQPILIDEDGAILDGHHRFEIADRNGLEYVCDVKRGLSEKDKRDLIFAVNVSQRPPLTSAQKREAITASLKADPELADLEHARRIGVHHTTVATIRNVLIANLAIAEAPERKRADGKRAPGRKPKVHDPKPVATPEPEPEAEPDAEPGAEPKAKRKPPEPAFDYMAEANLINALAGALTTERIKLYSPGAKKHWVRVLEKALKELKEELK